MGTSRPRVLWWFAAIVALNALACASTVVPEDEAGSEQQLIAPDGNDSQTVDASADDALPPDASITPYNDIADAQNWSTLDLGAIRSTPESFAGTAFDGRYLYFAPAGDGPVLRYDTTSQFGTAASWSDFDATRVDARASEFRGAAFDGRFVYFVPYGCPTTCHDTSGLRGVVTRYDTLAPFDNAASWNTFDLASIDARATGFVGAAFDGRYLYLVPYGRDTAYQSVVVRLDTTAAFASSGSWTLFDTTTVNPGSQGFYGATFDGRYLYLSPYARGSGEYNSIITRYDTHATFDDASSWSTFDTSTADLRAIGYFGATFDGRYAYFVPYTSDGSYAGLTARFDTTRDFGDRASWSFFDTRSLGVFPQGALFDGRYVYLVPSAGESGPSGRVARFDTRGDFTSRASWSTFDTSTLNPDAVWFWGGGFDGRFLYFAPSVGHAFARFDARNPPAMPAAYDGSFF